MKLKYVTIHDYYGGQRDIMKNFQRQASCMDTLFVKCLPDVETKAIESLIINCCPPEKVKTSELIDTSYEVYYGYDTRSFLELSDQDKKKALLEIVYEGVEIAARENDWCIIPFEKAKRAVIDLDYKNAYLYKKPKSSPNRKYKAVYLIQHELYSAEIFLVILDNAENELQRIHLFSEEPEEGLFLQLISDITWRGNSEIFVKSQYRESLSKIVTLQV
ncbi:hypothetical protein [Listeria booriae]|uniref:hypothetical protein n=1 Tax=Listeria booriae TaxID=1552123 RepID=UPI001627602D|nr:hypothetical protein [Listeria booriae]MBC2147826.1 hypothetical protein [Listeria booriae]